MREIKFRGMPIFGNELVYGYLNVYRNEKGDVYEIINNESGKTRYDVKPETVGQYTGLKDKNGEEMYEGDIVSGLHLMMPKAEIIKLDGVFGVVLADSRHYPLRNFGNIEVIGNIYENPELLNN